MESPEEQLMSSPDPLAQASSSGGTTDVSKLSPLLQQRYSSASQQAAAPVTPMRKGAKCHVMTG